MIPAAKMGAHTALGFNTAIGVEQSFTLCSPGSTGATGEVCENPGLRVDFGAMDWL